MISSAFVLLVHGLVLLFAPEFLFIVFDVSVSSGGFVTAQLFSAALIGLGLMNWTARGVVLGGIYGRALVYGNFAHAFVGFFIGLRARLVGFANGYFWTEIALYLAFTIAFGVMLFRGPLSKPAES